MDEERGKPQLPTPTIWPIGLAAGLACLLVGLVVSWWLVAIGGGVALIFGFLWIADLSRARAHEPEQAVVEKPKAVRPSLVKEKPSATRKAFLSGATLGVGGVIGGMVTVPPVLFALIPPFLKQGHPEVDLGPLDNFAQDKWVITKFFEDPKTGDVTRRTAYIRYNGPLANGQPSFTILSSGCVHLGCPVQANGPVDEGVKKVRRPGGQLVELQTVTPAGFGCPCHGGQYDTEGNRTAGPPVRALDRWAYAIKNNRLVLTKRYSVGTVTGTGADAKIKRYDLADPGQHVDGWEQVFYPIQPPRD